MSREEGRQPAIPSQPDPAVEQTSFAAEATQNDMSALLEDYPVLSDHSPLLQRSTPDNASLPATPAKSSVRALAPDMLRGLLMIFMAMDHNSLALRAFPHATNTTEEADSEIVRAWTPPVPYAIRTLSHLCAPGFMFLLGMGVVYFGRSRTNLGWSSGRMMRHFVIRCVALILISFFIEFVVSGGEIRFLTLILFALGINYILTGLLWVTMSKTEHIVAYGLLGVLPDTAKDDIAEPLLGDRERQEHTQPDQKTIRASTISWHLHNALLFLFTIVTIWWNIWLSPTHGYCGKESDEATEESPWTDSPWLRIWFYSVNNKYLNSVYPPLPWLSFALLGTLYGRIIIERSWSTAEIAAANGLTGVAFMLTFVLSKISSVICRARVALRIPNAVPS
ncbi:hypothetical protein GQ53DRAFT_707545 [Thozetella sp. PMI_491]|nr:hypothetical protein GQ53DRAFT_707545 [Thozetella sp. PMI_491]